MTRQYALAALIALVLFIIGIRPARREKIMNDAIDRGALPAPTGVEDTVGAPSVVSETAPSLAGLSPTYAGPGSRPPSRTASRSQLRGSASSARR